MADTGINKQQASVIEARLSKRVALVTGGSRGIGAAIAEAFASNGARVAIWHAGDGERAVQTLDKLNDIHEGCIAIECDVSKPDLVSKAVDAAVSQIGEIEILVNCAGVGGDVAFEHFTPEIWNRIIGVNLTGSFLASWACYPGMKEKGWGRIINISSQMAFLGGVAAAAYCASKAGVIGLTRALAVEAAPHGVLVNCIAPGATMTDMLLECGEELMAEILKKIPLGRFALPHEIASTAVLLASEEGSFYVGQTLSPNGGDALR